MANWKNSGFIHLFLDADKQTGRVPSTLTRSDRLMVH
jgi:hypothetical protein